MTRKQLEDFFALIAEIKTRNCTIPEEVFQLLKKGREYTRLVIGNL